MRAPVPAPAAPPGLTAALRDRARLAVQGLVQALLDEPRNRAALDRVSDRQALAGRLFRGALLLVHRTLFRLKLEASRAAGRPSAPPPDGALPGEVTAPFLEEEGLFLPEGALSLVRDHLSWLPAERGSARRRVPYESLEVEDLGSVYEGLLPLSPGIATQPMRRRRRRQLEVIVPLANAGDARRGARDIIPEGAFYLGVGLGRKVSGSYYTPRSLVRFLIREALGPHVEARSPVDRPDPDAILGISVLDPAMGTGHFLVEACRFLADALVAAWARAGELGAISRAASDPLRRARRLVAERCLYGVDRDPAAVDLARLSLHLEAAGDGPKVAPLDRHLLCGDSLTGPPFERLLVAPCSGGPLDPLLCAALRDRLDRDLSTNRDLTVFKTLAAAWTGAVMLGQDMDGDHEALARAIAAGEDGRAAIEASPALRRAVEIGREGVSHDLAFPEVFWPRGLARERRGGFSAVVGNPPWDAVRRNDDELYARFDVDVLDLPDRAEKLRRIEALSREPEIVAAFAAYVQGLERKDRIVDALFEVHKARVRGALAGRGTYDDYMLFAERAAALLAPESGIVGMIFPSAFHASEGAVGVRRLYFESLQLLGCFSFENRRRLFEIDGRCKFALVVARSEPRTRARAAARCTFYREDPAELDAPGAALLYEPSFIARTGGDHLALLELRSAADMRVAEVLFGGGETFGGARARLRVTLGQEVNMTYAAHRFTPTSTVLPAGADPREPAAARRLREAGYLPLHEGKTFHQYTDRWEARPRHVIALSAIADRPAWARAARYHRLAFRDIASSTNERTGIFALLPPGVLCGNKAPCEREPSARPAAASLLLLAIAGSFPFDHALRLRVQSTVNLFILDACPVPPAALTLPRSRFLAHAALRLSCNHEGYLPLWQEQLGPGTWRETTPVFTWPVLAGDGARWAVRAAIDAVVAEAYGLDRGQYAAVLSGFKHSLYADAPALCLAAFDELSSAGLAAFLERNDPYHDVPLVEAPPAPVIDLPGAPR